MSHSHHHPHDTRHAARNQLKTTWILTFLLFVFEVYGGFKSNSLSLLSDAGHMLGDLFALSLSMVSILWALRRADQQKTYGYHRAEVLATMINGALLLYVAIQIALEALHRFYHPQTINLKVMLPIAVAGLVVNFICMFLLKNYVDHLVTRSAFYHVVSDLVSSLCVIVSGVVVYFTQRNWIEAPVSLLIALLIVRNGLKLLKEVYDILMEASPAGISLEKVRKAMMTVEGVSEIHDLHVWSLGAGYSAASAHLLVPNMDLKNAEGIIMRVNRILREDFHIEHTTLQLAPLQEPAKIRRL